MRIIAGDSRGRRLKSVHRSGTRPTMDRVKETLFAILTPCIGNSRFLDLFAGAGTVGLEAISRGASLAVFVDSSRSCAEVLRENIELMGVKDRAQVIGRAWSPALSQISARGDLFDIIFADPPYEQESILLPLIEAILHRQLLVPGGWFIAQHTIRLQLPDSWPEGPIKTTTRRFGETMLTFYRHQPSFPDPHTPDPEIKPPLAHKRGSL